MSGIISSTGLMSGLPTQDIINQLIAVESRPMTLLKNRVGTIQTQRTAYVDLSARLMSLKGIVSRFKDPKFFSVFAARSSDESVLTATAGSNARPGSLALRVHSLVSNHQLVATGLPDADTTPVGVGQLTVEIGNGKLGRATPLDRLNGGKGVRRGRISITDRSGATAEIDLRTAMSVEDVVRAINADGRVQVRASVSGDRIIVEDLTPASQALADGALAIADVGYGHTATDLGLADGVAGAVADDRIEGADVMNLADSTRLSVLNDGNGVRRNVTGADFRITVDGGGAPFEVTLSDFLRPTMRLEQLNNGNGVRLGTIRITDRSGRSAQVDLSAAQTVQDVIDAINGAGLGVSATIVSSHLQIRDDTNTAEETATNLRIEDVSGHAARDLGIAADNEASSISGSNIFRVSTIGDVVRAINFAEGNFDGYSDGAPLSRVTASVSDDGNGITLVSNWIGGGEIVVETLDETGQTAAEGGTGQFSSAANDLGIEGTFSGGQAVTRDLIAGLNTVLLRSLNGGRGVAGGSIRSTARDGTSHTYDLSGVQTLQDVIDRINAGSDQSKVGARLNAVGHGIEIYDKSGAASGVLRVEESGGTTAADLGVLQAANAAVISGANLQLQYVSESTPLDNMNYGDGVRTGEFRITNSLGGVFRFHVTGSQSTVGDVLRVINAQSDASGVTASINSTGDGILLTDENGGTGALLVEDTDGGAAADLNIAGEAAAGSNFIDGTLEITIDVDADDTLNDVTAKINEAGARISASLINDGSATSPFRLTVSSDVSGRRGELLFDAGGTGLSMQTLVEARDAIVILGDDASDNPIVIASSTNSLEDVADGLTIDLVGTSTDAVTIDVSQDLEQIISDLDSFVTNFNAIQDRIDEYTAFDPETEVRGTLLGDYTVRRIEDRLNRVALRSFDGGSTELDRLADVGIRFVDGARLQFDEDKFREVYAEDPTTVEALFTDGEGGIGKVLDDLLDELTRSDDGLLSRHNATLQGMEDDLNRRIATMQTSLDRRRAQLERQFIGLETALSQLQNQQNALASIRLPGSS